MDKYDDKMVDMLRQRIAELEVAGDALCRALEKTLMEKGAAEDKLARVKEWCDSWGIFESLNDILSDTRKPLATSDDFLAKMCPRCDSKMYAVYDGRDNSVTWMCPTCKEESEGE